MSKIIKVKTEKDLPLLKPAALALRKGKVVAFPTETVYGLGANAFNAEAVKKIFKLKGRPPDNPLIVHIGSPDDIEFITEKISPIAHRLIEKFFPGPLTLVMKKSELIPPEITAGRETVAVRMPDHRVASYLIKKSQVPVAAPSANISGRPSATTARHILEDFKGKIDYIIDAGEVSFGVESTVLDVTVDPPEVLRPGALPVEKIEDVIGKPVKMNKRKSGKIKSPGMKYRHYKPACKVIYCKKGIEKCSKRLREIETQKVLFITTKKTALNLPVSKMKIVNFENTAFLARKLFSTYRSAEKEGYEVIMVDKINEKGLGRAIMDRVEKSADEVW